MCKISKIPNFNQVSIKQLEKNLHLPVIHIHVPLFTMTTKSGLVVKICCDVFTDNEVMR